MNNTCPICGGRVPDGRRIYCSEGCYKISEKRRQRVGTGAQSGNPEMVHTFTCPDCGKIVTRPTKCTRCEECQDAANRLHNAIYRRSGARRPLGSTDKCARCGKEYIVFGGKQKYCPACKESATAEAIREQRRASMEEKRNNAVTGNIIRERKRVVPKEKICKYCKKTFSVVGNGEYCSEECRLAAKKEYLKEYDKARAEQKRAAQKARYESMTSEQREEANRRARENYRKRKSKEHITK